MCKHMCEYMHTHAHNKISYTQRQNEWLLRKDTEVDLWLLYTHVHVYMHTHRYTCMCSPPPHTFPHEECTRARKCGGHKVRQVDIQLEASLGNLERPCVKTKK